MLIGAAGGPNATFWCYTKGHVLPLGQEQWLQLECIWLEGER